MRPIEMLVTDVHDIPRANAVVEQGVPTVPISLDEARRLAVLDENGRAVPATVQVEGTDQDGRVRWLLVSFAVSLAAGEQRRFYLGEGECPSEAGLEVNEGSSSISVVTPRFSLEFTDPGSIRLSTRDGTILAGGVDFELRSDARSAVGNLRPVQFEPHGYRITERSDRRIRILFTGRYRAWTPKSFQIDPAQRYDAEVEFTVYADSPVIRLRWRITNLMQFNCPYMWLDRYLLSLPLAEGARVVDGDRAGADRRFDRWVQVGTPGGVVATTFPLRDWLGAGGGIEVDNQRILQGGVDPPPDGGFGGTSPDIHRMFFYGMSRTFEGSLLVGASREEILSELRPLCIVVPPEHYSACGELPENGGEVTFGPWQDVVDRAASHLLDTQWKGTLWWGEWWRERDIDHDLGVEETNSGNSALGPLYHFYRTGDYRFYESAKMSYYYTYDIQFCKRSDGHGPYMHTRRFLLDHQEWFHPRYQRVGGMIRPSHLFADPRVREKVIWYLRLWGERYIADDGAPLVPNRDGSLTRATERAMSNVAEAMMYAYIETADSWFLDKARRIGDWIVRSIEDDVDTFAENSNSTRYILRGLLLLCRLTNERRYRDAFVSLAEWTVNAPTFDYGTHYVAFHFYYACEAYKMSKRRDILLKILDLAKWVLSRESHESPGTYPFLQENQYPAARWICIYDNKAIVSYLPVLASTLQEAGIPVGGSETAPPP